MNLVLSFLNVSFNVFFKVHMWWTDLLYPTNATVPTDNDLRILTAGVMTTDPLVSPRQDNGSMASSSTLTVKDWPMRAA